MFLCIKIIGNEGIFGDGVYDFDDPEYTPTMKISKQQNLKQQLLNQQNLKFEQQKALKKLVVRYFLLKMHINILIQQIKMFIKSIHIY